MSGQPGWLYGEVVNWWNNHHTGFARVVPDEGNEDLCAPVDVMFFQSTTYPYHYRPQPGDMLAMRVRDSGKGPFAKVAVQTGTVGYSMIGRITRGGPSYGFIEVDGVDYFFNTDAVVDPLSSRHLFPGQPVVFYYLPDPNEPESSVAVRVMPVTRSLIGVVEGIRLSAYRGTFFLKTPRGRAVYSARSVPRIRIGDAVHMRVLSNQFPPTQHHPRAVWWAVTMERIN